MKIPGMGCIAILMGLSIILIILWLYFFVKPCYKWLNKKLDAPIYDETKNIVLEGPRYGKPQALHHNIINFNNIHVYSYISFDISVL